MTTASTVLPNDWTGFALRLFAWGTVSVAFAFLLETWLVHWRGQAGALSGGVWALLAYALGVALAVVAAWRGQGRGLRDDAAAIAALTNLVARWAFWWVLIASVVDVTLSFLRVEGFLAPLVGHELDRNLGQASFRGPYVHMPIAALAIPLALLTRGVPFIWLALLVVLVQLGMVLGRFVFSYEQTFLSDLVRTFYSALFLFASAWTLAEEGHVRVDVFYSNMSERAKALVNGIGAVVLGMPLMWIILIIGTATPASTIVAPILRYETSQTGTAMMNKYWLAAFLGIFALTMLIQFAAYVLKAAADWRGEPDGAAPNARHA